MSGDGKNFQDLEAHTAQEWLEAGKAVLIDIRGADEYAHVHVKGARLVPLATLGETDLSDIEGKVGIFMCASGMRTKVASGQIKKTAFKEVYNLKNGLAGWLRAGLPVEGSKAGRACTLSARTGFILYAVVIALALGFAILNAPNVWQGALIVLIIAVVALFSPCIGGRILPYIMAKKSN